MSGAGWYSSGGPILGSSWTALVNASTSMMRVAPPSAPKDFEGLPFDLSLGEVYGLRVWKVDSYGRLRARHIDSAKPWRPGVNVAECNGGPQSMPPDKIIDPEDRGRVGQSIDYEYALTPSGAKFIVRWTDGTVSSYDSIKFSKDATHEAPDEKCKCGFYAYTETDHEEVKKQDGLILGVVKGTGRTLMGVRGFRSEKAEIVALLNPAGTGEGPASSRPQKTASRIAEIYPGVPLLPTRKALLQFAPVESMIPDPGTEAFWELP